MKELAALLALHTKVDAFLETARSALAEGDVAGAHRWQLQQRLNDQAYFLICWGQLESKIDDLCRSVIRIKGDDARWEVRRGWDLYNPDDKRLSGLAFEDRLGFVLYRRAGRGSPWARTLRYYGIRNQIAHGRLQSDAIDLAAVVADFYKIQGALQG